MGIFFNLLRGQARRQLTPDPALTWSVIVEYSVRRELGKAWLVYPMSLQFNEVIWRQCALLSSND
jgi:hypothetical protein